MTKLEKLRKEYQSWGKWYYPMALDSLGERNLFNDRDEFINGMNVVAIGQFLHKVGVIQFDLMRNHGHFIVCASGQQCCGMFDYLRYRLNARLINDGFQPLPEKWFFMLRRLETKAELVNAVSYSARNSYDARRDLLPGGYLWSSNYLMFSDVKEMIEYKTVGGIGTCGMIRLLGSKVKLPEAYKVCKLGFVLPESYIMKTEDGSMTKARSLYKDSKDYTYRLFRDYDTYKRLASDLGETWSPSGSDVDALIDNVLNINFGVQKLSDLDPGKKCDLAVILCGGYGLEINEIASRLNLSRSMVSRLIYSYNKEHK